MNQGIGAKTSRAATSGKVFISYKRNVSPDEQIAKHLLEALQAAGHTVFMDVNLRVGQKWAEEIERQVRAADFIIPLLTASSCASEMFVGEISIARDHSSKNGSKPQILPVRLGLTGELPYPLNGWLDPIQAAIWRTEEDTGKLVAELLAAVAGAPLSSCPNSAIGVNISRGGMVDFAPLPSLGGSVDINDPRYIRRQTDEMASKLICQSGGITLTIMGSRQMGKSSLLMRVLAEARARGKSCAHIDFRLLGANILRDRTTFFRWFVHNITKEMNVPCAESQEWDSQLSDSQNCTGLIERCVLNHLDRSLVVAIDEADRLFEADLRNEFFGMLRAWHNSRAYLGSQVWRKLDLVLVTSTEPNHFIIDQTQSPFNVGAVLQLRDFTQEQVRELSVRHKSPLAEADIVQLFELLNGQPYLTRRAFYMLESGVNEKQLFESAADDNGPFGDHLRNYFFRLSEYPALTVVLKQIALESKRNRFSRFVFELMGRIFHKELKDPTLIYRLEAAGLVKTQSGKVIPRCRLYADYFGSRL